jgi:hypothetical protein
MKELMNLCGLNLAASSFEGTAYPLLFNEGRIIPESPPGDMSCHDGISLTNQIAETEAVFMAL